MDNFDTLEAAYRALADTMALIHKKADALTARVDALEGEGGTRKSDGDALDQELLALIPSDLMSQMSGRDIHTAMYWLVGGLVLAREELQTPRGGPFRDVNTLARELLALIPEDLVLLVRGNGIHAAIRWLVGGYIKIRADYQSLRGAAAKVVVWYDDCLAGASFPRPLQEAMRNLKALGPEGWWHDSVLVEGDSDGGRTDLKDAFGSLQHDAAKVVAEYERILEGEVEFPIPHQLRSALAVLRDNGRDGWWREVLHKESQK